MNEALGVQIAVRVRVFEVVVEQAAQNLRVGVHLRLEARQLGGTQGRRCARHLSRRMRWTSLLRLQIAARAAGSGASSSNSRWAGPGRGCYHATRSPIDQTLSERPSLMRAPKAQVSARKRSGKRTAGISRRVLESDGLFDTKRSSTEGVRHAALYREGEPDLSGSRTEGREWDVEMGSDSRFHSPRRLFYLGARGASGEKFLGRRTPLYDLHVEQGARMVDFGGWDMPVNYGSQIEEHHAVRRDAGIFDVSHMCVIDARGPRVREFFSKLIANDVAKLTVSGKALYSCMLNEAGGVIDDLIVYFLDESWFRAVVNAGTRDKDLAWMRKPRAGVRRRAHRAHRSRHARGARTECAREGGGTAAGRTSRSRARARGVLRTRARPLVRRAHGLHRRRRIRNHAARRRGRARCGARSTSTA